MKALGERETKMDSEPQAAETTARRMYKSSVEQKGPPDTAHPTSRKETRDREGSAFSSSWQQR